MTGMGPESLLVRERLDPRVVLAEYALRDRTREEVRGVEEMIRRELEMLPVRHSLGERLRGWGRQRFRRADVPLAAAPALARGAMDREARDAAETAAYADVSLAALPAQRAAPRPAGGGPLVCAAPLYARD